RSPDRAPRPTPGLLLLIPETCGRGRGTVGRPGPNRTVLLPLSAPGRGPGGGGPRQRITGNQPMSRSDDHNTPATAAAYCHDRLEAAEAARVEQHCDGCASCRAALERGRQRRAVLAALPAHEPSEGLVRSTLQAVEDHRQRWQGRRRRFFATV